MSDPAPASPPRAALVVAVLAAAAVGFGAAWFLRPAADEGTPEEEAAEATVAEPAPDGNAVTSLGAFTVNLRGGGGGRMLRLEVQVEGPAEHASGLEARSAQIRDSIITAVSDHTWSDLEGASGKTRLRDELLARVTGIATSGAVERIYFTQFVVQ